MIAMTQDPSLPFDPHHLTAAVYPAMSFPLAPVILLAWVIPFVIMVIYGLMSLSDDPDLSDRYRVRMWVAAWVTGALLAGPVIANGFVSPHIASHNQDVVPNVPGYVLTTKTDGAGEFADWARQRYGTELTAEQAHTLMNKKLYYGGRSDNVSDVVLLDGHEVHGFFDDHSQIRLMGSGVELETKR